MVVASVIVVVVVVVVIVVVVVVVALEKRSNVSWSGWCLIYLARYLTRTMVDLEEVCSRHLIAICLRAT